MEKANAKVSVAEILNFMKFEGMYGQVSAEVKCRRASAEAARKAGLRIRSVELQKAADSFRLQKGLFRASDTEEWLDSNGLTHQVFEEYLEANLLIRKFKKSLEKEGGNKKPLLTREVKRLARDSEYGKWLRRAAR